jgi:hypothetical protein
MELAGSLALGGQICVRAGPVADGVSLVVDAAGLAEDLREPSLVFKVKAAIDDISRSGAASTSLCPDEVLHLVTAAAAAFFSWGGSDARTCLPRPRGAFGAGCRRAGGQCGVGGV